MLQQQQQQTQPKKLQQNESVQIIERISLQLLWSKKVEQKGEIERSSFKHSEKKIVTFCNHHFQKNISNNFRKNVRFGLVNTYSVYRELGYYCDLV